MTTEQEHEIVPSIRGWLAATSDVEIPIGISRGEARRRAREILAALCTGMLSPNEIEVDDDLKDVLWAALEELSERPPGQGTFGECHRFYQFVLAVASSDLFNECDEILHSVARIGWQAAPGGLEGILKARAQVWEHPDEVRYREICETADRLPARIERLRQFPDIGELRDIFARLVRLSDINPPLVAPLLSALETVRIEQGTLGFLDDQEHLKASVSLLAGIAERQLGQWERAEEDYRRAVVGFRRTSETADVDRVESERLAVALVRQDVHTVIRSAPRLLEHTVIPRERVKARLLLASALLAANRPQDSLSVLEAVESDPAIESEPTFQAWLLTKRGSAYSYLGRGAEAIESFKAAGLALSEFNSPMQLGNLAASIGEHLARSGELEQATVLYRKARAISTQLGQLQQAGYLSVLLAELLMMLGRPDEAEAVLVAVLPTVEVLDLRREALAAVALLREAVAKRSTDVKTIQVLRDQLRKGLH